MKKDQQKLLIGLKLKNFRKQLKYKQERLCNELDIDISGYSKIENGKNYPSFETICGIMKLLKINPNDLFDFIDYKSSESDLTDKIICEEVKNLSNKDKNKMLTFIKLIKD